MKISNQFTEQNHKGFIEIFQFQLFQLCPRHKSGGDGMKGAGARDRVCPRTGVQRWLRVNSNASLPGAQWSTLYPCMRGQQHDGGREGGWQREGGTEGTPGQGRGEDRGQDGLNQSVSWQVWSLLSISGFRISHTSELRLMPSTRESGRRRVVTATTAGVRMSLFKKVVTPNFQGFGGPRSERKYPQNSTPLSWKVKALNVVGSAGRREKHSRVEQLFSWRPAPRISHGVRKPSDLRL